MSETKIFTEEELAAMKRPALQAALKGHNLPATGTTPQLRIRLADAQVEQVETTPVEDTPPEFTPTDDDDKDGDGNVDKPSESNLPEPDFSNLGDGLPAVIGDDTPPPADGEGDDFPEETTGRVPRLTSFGKPLDPEDPTAESLAKLCEVATLVRVFSTKVVQKINMPFGLGAKARAAALLGNNIKSFVNEELDAG